MREFDNQNILSPKDFHLLSEKPTPDEKQVPGVDVERVFRDHNLDVALLPRIAEQVRALDAFVVPSGSKYKARVNQGIIRQLAEEATIPVIIVKAPSLISEQPFGKETVEGAENRKTGAQKMIRSVKDGQTTGNPTIDILLRGKLGLIGAVENGLRQQDLAELPLEKETKDFDPTAEYVDVAYAIIDIPGVGTSKQTSPKSEAVLFPHEDVITTYRTPGGFKENTVGQAMQRRLEREGVIIDHQDPQAYLTNNTLTRSQQLATVVVKGFVDLASKSKE